MTEDITGQLVHFTMSRSEARHHVANLESISRSADKAGQEAIKALRIVLERELDKAERRS